MLQGLRVLRQLPRHLKATMEYFMDNDLAEASRRIIAENVAEIAKRDYNAPTKSIVQKHLQVVLEYLTDEQKEALRCKGYEV